MRLSFTANCCCCILFCLLTRSYGQDVTADTTLNGQLKFAVSNYHKAVYPPTALYNGIEYLPHNIAFVEGQPFFLNNKPSIGSVLYKNVFYENLRLMYDLTRQQLVVIHPINFQKIKLNNKDITEFTIIEHRFLNFQPQQHRTQKIPPGFYELLYNGKTTKLLKSSRKSITEELATGVGVLSYIKETNTYYIEKAGNYYPLSNRRSVIRAFEDRKKEITQFLKAHSVSPRTNNEVNYKLIVAYYDQLTGV